MGMHAIHGMAGGEVAHALSDRPTKLFNGLLMAMGDYYEGV